MTTGVMTIGGLKIGDVAARSGLPAKTIRYYEDIGLIPRARRTDGGYRAYAETDVQTLCFIQRARGLGFSVRDVEALLGLWRDQRRASADVKALALAHVAEIERKVAALEGMRDSILHLAERCHGDDRPECPILDDFAGATG